MTGFSAQNGTRDVGFCVLLLTLWVLAALSGHWQSPSSDLAPLYLAGHFLAEGRPELVYSAPPHLVGGTPAEWLETVAAMGQPWKDAFPYIYPPIWAKLLSYVTPHVGPFAFTRAAMVLQVSLLAGAVVLAARLARPAGVRPLIWVAVSLALIQTSVFSQTALYFNQPQITVMFLTLLAFERLQAGQDRTAGVLLGLAAAIKILPGVFVLLFFYERRWHAVAAFAATVGALVALSFLLAGPELHAEFLEAVDRVETSLPVVPSNASVQVSVLLLLHKLGVITLPITGVGAYLSPQVFPAVPVVALAARIAFLAAALMFAYRLWPLPPRTRRAYGLLALSVLIALFSPVGWLHYYTISLLLLPQLAFRASPRVAILALVVFGALTSSTLYINSVVVFGWDWTVMNITVSVVWLLVLALIWVLAGQRAPERAD
ncbi:glycosyltransferase family 87 protein [Defluviimonas sp. WL0075]|uniref:DUF2029 domain-containing protein n=1 Tax=Albidovulum sediminicola TaxID=2984331 RepID=A0ABT2Z401_9RHOB|nr:glycosyltransferase family 87 protein [Defluviimonas sp. WL0075]MCV2865501.1 DUF2029 domain-containing protein [Defluviimonas sp. WL0075]